MKGSIMLSNRSCFFHTAVKKGNIFAILLCINQLLVFANGLFTLWQWTLSVMTSKNKNGRCSVGTFVKIFMSDYGKKNFEQ